MVEFPRALVVRLDTAVRTLVKSDRLLRPCSRPSSSCFPRKVGCPWLAASCWSSVSVRPSSASSAPLAALAAAGRPDVLASPAERSLATLLVEALAVSVEAAWSRAAGDL